MNAKRLTFWIILVVFIGAGLFWTFYFPYNVRRLYMAIPGNASFISEHRQLGERWPEMADNPLIAELLQDLSADGDDLNKKQTAAILKLAANRDTVFAYVPELNVGGQSAWVFSSWVGYYGQLLRMGFFRNLMSDFDTTRSNGRKLWSMVVDDQKGPLVLSLAVNEGVLLGCLSRDPIGVEYLVRRVAAGRRIIPELEQSLVERSTESGEDEALDYGWLRMSRAGIPGGDISYAITSIDQASIGGRVNGRRTLGLSDLKIDGATQSELAEIFDGIPVAVSILPSDTGNAFADGRHAGRGSAAIMKRIQRDVPGDSVSFIGLFGGDYSGRVLVRVPTIMIGVRSPTDVVFSEWISDLLDSVNTFYGLGLIPRTQMLDDIEVVVLDTAKSNIYRNLSSSQKMAIAKVGNWVILSTSLSALEQLLRDSYLSAKLSRNQAGRSTDTLPAWAKGMTGDNSNAYLWVDLAAAGQSLRSAIAAYSLVLMAQSKPGNADLRARLDIVRQWIEHVEPLENCAIWLDEDAEGWQLRFQLGKQ